MYASTCMFCNIGQKLKKIQSPVTNLNCFRTAKKERLEEINLTLIGGLKLKELD